MSTAEPQHAGRQPDHVERVVAAMPLPTPERVGRLMTYFPARDHKQQNQKKPA